MFGRSRRERLIDPGEWPEASGRRVLIENGDGAELWAQADVLRQAGYRVATCRGPTGDDGWPTGADGEVLRCPLLETGCCPLVEGADVVVSGCGVGRSEALLAALTAVAKNVVFAAPAPTFDRYADVRGAAQLLPFPVTETMLLDTVAQAAWLGRDGSRPPGAPRSPSRRVG